ncbi:MAG: hypothetical protein WCO66_02285 [Candidatus Absconditabacteria bacterium]
MASSPQATHNFNGLSLDERLKQAPKNTKEAFLAQAKKDLFDDLMSDPDAEKQKTIEKQRITETLSSRHLLVQKIRENREQTKSTNQIYPVGKFLIRPGIEIELKGTPGYKSANLEERKNSDYLDRYEELNKKLNWPNLTDDDLQDLEELDNQLAEEMILNAGCSIEFAETEHYGSPALLSKGSFARLNTIDSYKDKIERISLKNNDNVIYIIKWTDDELKKINKKADELENEFKTNNINEIKSITPEIESNIKKIIDAGKIATANSLTKELKDAQDQNKDKKIFKKLLVKTQRIVRGIDNNHKPDEDKDLPVNPEDEKESIEVLELKKLVNRDNVSDQLKEIRPQNISEIGKKYIKLRDDLAGVKLIDQIGFGEYLQELLKSEDNPVRLKELDTEFAEKIILNNKLHIQIDNYIGHPQKTQEQIIEEAKTCVNNLKPLGYDLEYITVPEGNDIHHVVKQKINEPEPKPNPDPEEEIKSDKVWSATISNVEQVHMEEANYRAEEKARADYEALGVLSLTNLSTWHPWKRVSTYMMRSVRRQQRRNSHLSSVRGNIDLTRNDVVHASDRHEQEFADANWRNNIDQRIVNHENPDVNLLCQEFLTTAMDDRTFENRFNAILRNDNQVMGIIGTNNMDYLGSNILLKLKQEKAEVTMVDGIGNLLTNYNAATFEGALRTLTAAYFAETKRNFPAYIQRLLDHRNNLPELNNIINHQKSLLQIEVRTLHMQLQLLDNTTGAYEINNQDKEHAVWHRMGAWMDRHPYLTIGGGVLAGSAILAAGGFIGGVAGAVTATSLLSAKMGIITAAKKASHYTKEQKGQEKRLTHGLNIEQQSMANIRQVMQNAPWYSARRYRARRQFELYQNSTQRNVADTTQLTDYINRFIQIPGNLTDANQRNALQMYLGNALARVDYYKQNGHNFVASQDRAQVESDFRNLFTAMNEGAAKLGVTVDSLRANQTYTTLSGDLRNDYDASFDNFRHQRRNLELKYGIGSAILYAGASVGLQAVLGSGIFGHHPVVGTKTILVGGEKHLVLHDQVKASLAHSGASQENIAHIQKALETAQSQSPSAAGYNQQAWRTIVKGEMGWNDTQLNSWMNGFMKDTVWNLNEGGNELKTQLLQAKLNTMTAHSAPAEYAEKFLSSPKIHILQPGEGPKVLSNLQEWMNGKPINSFAAADRVKMGYFGHMFIHDDSGVGSQLTQELTKTTTTGGISKVVPGATEMVNRHYFFDGVGMPVYANTFMQRMKPEKDEVGKPIEAPNLGAIPEPSNLIIADKNHPAQAGTGVASWYTV